VKKTLVIIIGIALALFVLTMVKDLAIKAAVEKGVESVTGLKMGMKRFSAGIIRPVVDIKGLKIFNRREFEERVMVEMPGVYVDYDLAAILAGKIRLRKLYLHLKEFNVVKNVKGELNLNSLKVVMAEKDGRSPAGEPGALPPIRIDDLRLKIERAAYIDYSAGKRPNVKKFYIDIDEKYSNVTDLYALASLIVVKALANTTISGAAGFDLSGLQGSITNTLSSARAATAKTVTAANETIKKTTEAAGQAHEAISKTAETLGGLFK
jgi:hypothetical protein